MAYGMKSSCDLFLNFINHTYFFSLCQEEISQAFNLFMYYAKEHIWLLYCTTVFTFLVKSGSLTYVNYMLILKGRPKLGGALILFPSSCSTIGPSSNTFPCHFPLVVSLRCLRDCNCRLGRRIYPEWMRPFAISFQFLFKQ